jgi:hypothetical protein
LMFATREVKTIHFYSNLLNYLSIKEMW